MRIVLAVAALGCMCLPAAAQDVYHQGYERQNGTYVEPHYQTRPDNNAYDNYSTRGNMNPYTGEMGTHNPEPGYGGYAR